MEGTSLVFEFVFPCAKDCNGFQKYVESLAPESGLQLIENCSSTTLVEGDWETAMRFLHQCREYIRRHESRPGTVTTVHIHG